MILPLESAGRSGAESILPTELRLVVFSLAADRTDDEIVTALRQLGAQHIRVRRGA